MASLFPLPPPAATTRFYCACMYLSTAVQPWNLPRMRATKQWARKPVGQAGHPLIPDTQTASKHPAARMPGYFFCLARCKLGNFKRLPHRQWGFPGSLSKCPGDCGYLQPWKVQTLMLGPVGLFGLQDCLAGRLAGQRDWGGTGWAGDLGWTDVWSWGLRVQSQWVVGPSAHHRSSLSCPSIAQHRPSLF